VIPPAQTAVVMVNAIGQHEGVWSRLRQALPPRFVATPFTPDLILPYPQQVEQLAGLVAALGQPVHLVGWCTGPKMLLRTAIMVPDAVASLTFLNPSFKSPDRPTTMNTPYESELEALLTTVVARPQMAARLATVLAAQRSSGSAAQIGLPPELESSAGRVLTDPDLLVLYALRHLEFWSDDPLSDPRVRALRLPVNVIAGAHDVVVAAGDVDAVTGALPQSTVTTLEAGHFGVYTHGLQMATLIASSADGGIPLVAGAA